MNRDWKPAMLVVVVLVALSCAPTETETAEVTPEPAPVEEATDATVVDPDRYQVEAESDSFRIVRISYGAGEESVMHSHPAHLAVFLTDLDVEFQAPDGTVEPVHAEAGSHLFLPAGSHHPRNAGDQPFEGVAIELKPVSADAEAAAGETGVDPVEVDAEHYAVEFENDQIRVLRITYGPGEESTMHYHGEHAAVALNDQRWEMTLPDGGTQEISLAAGEAILVPAGVHLPRNAGDEAGEVVVVELK